MTILQNNTLNARNAQPLPQVEKRNVTFRQAKTGKHECRNVTATLLLFCGIRA